MKKTLTITAVIFAGLVIAGFVTVNYATRDIEVEEVEIASIPVETADGSIVSWTEEAPKEKTLPTPEQFELDTPPTPIVEAESSEQTPSARDKRRAEWEKRMNDPEFQQKMKERMKEGMARRYDSLFKYLHLTEEEKDGFMDIIVGKFDKLKGLGREVFGHGRLEISDESREKFNQANQEFQNEMKDYLGDDVYDVYVQYEQTEPERRHVERLNRELTKDNGSALTTEQQDQLITAMYEERANSDVYVMNNMSELPDAELMTETGRAKQIEQIDALTQKYTAQGAEILSEEQQAEFAKTVTRQAEHQKRFLTGRGGGRSRR
ncbi:MAG: hypothetical protein PF692_15510 [Kiritimatiellae bacterium]|jgi:hypothetical protein|nr:hypothetical protein [Kiritimatiellia bacterium]